VQVDGWIFRGSESPARIAQRCEEIALAYLAQPTDSDSHRQDCRTIATLLRETAEIHRQKAVAESSAEQSGGHRRRVS
jgi:hypothetical protein